MNIILIGTNGAGKSTLANRLYKEGYHILKEAPRGNNHAVMATLCLTDNNIVFDRWNVIDRLIYEEESEYLNLILKAPNVVNKNNVIIYMRNDAVPYSDEEDPSRSVQRPSYEERQKLDMEYAKHLGTLHRAGIIFYYLDVRPEIEKTYQIAKSMIENHMLMYGDRIPH